MRLILFTYFFLYWSVCSASLGLQTIDSSYKPIVASQVSLDMPPTRSQDTVGICGAVTACQIIDEANCAVNKIADCKSMSTQHRCSQLDIARYLRQAPTKTGFLDSSDFKGLNLLNGDGVHIAIQNFIHYTKKVARESCAPFDQVVAKVDDRKDAEKLEQSLWKRLENLYSAYRRESEKCGKCALDNITASGLESELREHYSLKASNQEMLAAFAEKSFDLFLEKLLIPFECGDMRNVLRFKGNWNFQTFPTQAGGKANYVQMIDKIKETLAQKRRPIALSFCAQEPLEAGSRKECESIKDTTKVVGGQHSVVIRGYRRVCNSQNKCYDAVQVQNSWGEGWQQQNDDGWVDARTLLDRTFYEKDSISWIEPST